MANDVVQANEEKEVTSYTNRIIDHLISGYLRENKLLQCFSSVIHSFFPMLFSCAKYHKYNPSTNIDTIEKPFGYFIGDIGYNKGIHEFQFKWFANKSVKNCYLARIGVGVCTSKTFCDCEKGYMALNDSGISYLIILYINKREEKKMLKSEIWNSGITGKIQSTCNHIGVEYQKEWIIKLVLDCDKNEIKFYRNNQLMMANRDTNENFIKIKPNLTYYPTIDNHKYSTCSFKFLKYKPL